MAPILEPMTSLAADPHEFDDPHEYGVTAFGVHLRVIVEAADLVPDVERALPPLAAPADGSDVVVTFVLRPDEDDLCQLWRDGSSLGPATGAEVAVCLLEDHLATALALTARGTVFVRAGVVQAGDGDRASWPITVGTHDAGGCARARGSRVLLRHLRGRG